MRRRFVPFLVALLTIAVAPALIAQGDGDVSTKMKYKSFKKWKIILPKETFSPAVGAIKVAHSKGDSFPTEADGSALAIDANGDGKVDTKAKGASAVVTLKGKTKDGKKLKYTVRLKNEGGWKWASSGAMVGTLGGQAVSIIDQNNNGKYNDFGEDAMIIGKGDAASYLSRIVNLKGSLYEISVSEDGTSVTGKPFTGPTGRLNLAKDYESKAKLVSAIVRTEEDGVSFDLAKAKKGMLVPIGEYKIAGGMVSKGQQSARIKGGDRTFKVMTDSDLSVKWGGPLRAEFEYTTDGENVTFAPNQVWYFGQAGEEYVDFLPASLVPKFVLTRKKNARRIREARFGS